MDCPLCQAPMAPVKHGDVELDVCSKCGAGWFDGRELAGARGDGALERALRAGAHLRTTCRVCAAPVEGAAEPGKTHCGAPVRVRCARCGAVMSGVDARPAALDVCLWCGGVLVPAAAMAALGQLAVEAKEEAPPATGLPVQPSAIDQLVSSSWGGRILNLLE